MVGLRTEYKENPLGIDVRSPRLSWRIESAGRGVVQTAYEVRVARSERGLPSKGGLVWSSGKVASDESIQRPYEGPALRSGERYSWQVRVWDGSGKPSAWSAPAWWEMGLLSPSDWKASWIEPGLPEDVTKSGPVPMLRREFKLGGVIERARAYVTSHGLYEMYLNGHRVGDAFFTPGWTSYNKRLQYQTYDVTALLKTGANAVGVQLGNGWYRGNLPGGIDRRNVYGERLALLLQLEVTYTDGREELIGTDQGWKAATGPILMAEIYHGETYDARLEKPGWTAPGFDDQGWSAVQVVSHRKDDLVAPAGPPVRRIEELKPVKILRTPAGDTVADMGQNMVGWVRLKAQGPAGTTVTLRHAEVLDKQGNLYTENLRAAKATARYTLKGGGPETFEPHFTFFGFRYVAVDGYPGELTPDALTGVVVHSDMAPASEFETSKPLVNQLQHNILWGQKGNFLDVPTDCPQRDERLGWTGDAQVFSRTAAFNMDVAGFFTKWLRDVAADQFEDGRVPHVVPNVLTRPDNPAAGSAGWADAAVIVPWNMYLAYGDRRILEEQYDSMARWVEYERKRAGDDYLWTGDFHFGDWLAYAAPSREARSYPGATTGKDLIATAFFAHSTDLLQRTALVLGKRDDAARYGDQLARIKSAFREEFVSGRGRVGENTQTAYVLALQFDLLPEELRPRRGEAAGRGDPGAEAPDDRLPRHAVPLPRSEPVRVPGRGVPAAQPRGVPVVALPGEAGRHHDLGAVGQPEAGRQLRGQLDELLQPLRVRRHRRVDVPGDGRHRDRRERPGLQARPHPAAARRRIHRGQSQPRDDVRKGEFRVDGRGRPLRARRRSSRKHPGHGAAAGSEARRRDGEWRPAQQRERSQGPEAGRRRRGRGGGLRSLRVRLCLWKVIA